MAQLQCIVVTPEATVLDRQVDFVALPLYDGEIGIAPGRAPLIGRMGYGELRLQSDGQTQRYYVDGGFVQVAANVVSVLTSRAIPAEQLDPRVAEEQLAESRRRKANSDDLLSARERVQQQVRAQIRVARHAHS